MSLEPSSERLTVAIPIYNDWNSLRLLLGKLDAAAAEPTDILIIDDASTVPCPEADLSGFGNLSVSVVQLKRNLGHQRAIALGLAYIEANVGCKAVVVMDGDGEDDPADLPRLIEKCESEGFRRMVFARRAVRTESATFRLFYAIYRHLFRVLTGQEIRIGNFSIVPRGLLPRLVVVSEIWNHYAVGARKAKMPYCEIPVRRGRRLAGRSTMNFVSLVTHGLSAISVYGEVAGARLLITSCSLIAASLLVISAAVFIRLTTELAIPGWTTYVVGIFLVVMVQAVILSLFFIFIVLGGRNSVSFIPQRDYELFISGCTQVYTCPTLTSAASSKSSAGLSNGRLTTGSTSGRT